MNLNHVLALTLFCQTAALHVGAANFNLVQRLLSQFADEEADAITHHRKPLLEGESDTSLTEAIYMIREMERKHQVSPDNGDGLIHALQNAKNLRSVALQLGDLPRNV